jgi:hypothetical protein
VCYYTNVSEESIASIFRVVDNTSEEKCYTVVVSMLATVCSEDGGERRFIIVPHGATPQKTELFASNSIFPGRRGFLQKDNTVLALI